MADPASQMGVTPEVTAAAEHWLGRRDRGFSPAEARDFAAWRAAAPAHATEFDRLAAAWDAADLLRADPGLAALAQQVELDTRREQRQRSIRRARWAWTGGLAAAAALAIVWVPRGGAPAQDTAGVEQLAVAEPIAVVPGTARSLALPDGSIAELRGDSEVRTRFTASERRVELVRGEAHFTVAPHRDRPFVVQGGGVAVRAVGTAFNVKLEPAAVEVLVTEGVISLHEGSGVAPAETLAAAPRVVAGERAWIETPRGAPALATLAVERVSPARLDQSLAWQGTRVVLNRAPLGDAIAVFNRHGARIELGDASLQARQLSGTFRAGNAEALVRLLEQAGEVRVERRADGAVVLFPGR